MLPEGNGDWTSYTNSKCGNYDYDYDYGDDNHTRASLLLMLSSSHINLSRLRSAHPYWSN